MNGKDKCELLKSIRKKIAYTNNIDLECEECNFEGDCSGTCPKCEEELRYLEKVINEKRNDGITIHLQGIFQFAGKPRIFYETEGPDCYLGFPTKKRRFLRDHDITTEGVILPEDDDYWV
ncbi:MAG: hypothetical protein J6P12_10620 [Methanobrevibacter sp.]|nr:hypothetical protein [Methanobrevibacter sp.]